jgi:hypothetical protein
MMIMYIVVYVAVVGLVGWIYSFGKRMGRRNGFIEGWYFRHEKEGHIPDELLKEIVPDIFEYGTLVYSTRRQSLLKWLAKENPKIGGGVTFHAYVKKRKIELDGLIEYVEKHGKSLFI